MFLINCSGLIIAIWMNKYESGKCRQTLVDNKIRIRITMTS
jgi:hypothetical protein